MAYSMHGMTLGCRSRSPSYVLAVGHLGKARPSAGLSWKRRLSASFERSRSRLVSNVAQSQQQSTDAGKRRQKREVKDDPTPFFEPLLRSFLLGLTCGAVFESLHVALKFVGLVTSGEIGVHSITDALPSVADRFAPLFLHDHVVALSSWLLFYIIEAVAVYSVLAKYPNDADAAARAVGKLVTIPKKMLPMRLQLFKQLLLKGVNPLRPAAAIAVADAPTSGILTVPGIRASVVPAPPRAGATETLPKPSKPLISSPPVLRPQVEEDEQPGSLAERRERVGLRPGQLDPRTAEIGHRMQELAGRRMYLRNFWYAAGISEQVKDKPVGVEILGEKVVLFRDAQGAIQCLHDVCPHRGAPLHRGWVAEVEGHDCVVCPYHGWAFDGEGVLQDVPAAEHQKEWPRKQLVQSYPVKEKGGFIWLFYGPKTLPEEERPPIPYVPELDDPTWQPVYGDIEFECNHWSVFENAIDMAHIHYLHNDTFGNQGQPQIRHMTCSTEPYGVTASFGLHNKPVNAMWEFSKVPEVKVTAQALLPSTSVISFTLGNGLSFTTFVNTVPINENRTINRFALIRRLDTMGLGPIFNLSAWDSVARQAMIRILSEDKAMVEQLKPEMLLREISVKADLPQTAFRKLRQSFVDLGFGVAPDANKERFRSDF
ncbi:hypothetical protein CVIRNUC_010212 [Coccomyxa viridis]|uniref:Rieske domain-containing protein n=1 Tax=Coccomyxa viridis TaxID=1274662 RepID=A0AAV1IK26_9CHLO|nr:hypothetical protein CVIRNUC_010212 [Coccomyxa viridis]